MSSILRWTTTLPKGWKAMPLKAVATYNVSSVDKVPAEDEEPVRLCNYTDVYHNDFIRASSMNLMPSTATPQEIERFHLEDGDVVITKDSEEWDDIGVPALVVEAADDLVCGYHLAIVRPRPSFMSGRFLFRCLQSKAIRLQLELSAKGVTRVGLPNDEAARCLLPTPPLSEQDRIAEYLDAETDRIDGLIAEKERFLALLEEKRAAIVTQAVTHGLDPRVQMKPSGLDWAGEIPQHWQVMRLKFVLASPIEQGWSPQCENRLAGDEEWGVLKVGCVNGDKFNSSEHKALPAEIGPEKGYEVRTGDILMSRGNTLELVGQAALVEAVRERLLISDLHYRYRVDESFFHSAFLVAQLRCPWGRGQIESQAVGSSPSMKKIGKEMIQNMWLFVPPIEEQRSILSYIDESVRHFAEVEKATASSIALLRERRSAVITAAVTGAIRLGGMT